MDRAKIVRAWKDPKYRQSLSEEEKAQLPPHPSGDAMELKEDDLSKVAGGHVSNDNSCGYICTLTTECPMIPVCGS